jgi:hypothetical protein
MTVRSFLVPLAIVATASIGLLRIASADEEKHENLKVLADNGKDLDNGMKALTKGLGVKCEACHVKGERASDKLPTKEDARKFLTAVVGEKDKAKRDEALKSLLTALKLEKAKNPDELWKGIEQFKKK